MVAGRLQVPMESYMWSWCPCAFLSVHSLHSDFLPHIGLCGNEPGGPSHVPAVTSCTFVPCFWSSIFSPSTCQQCSSNCAICSIPATSTCAGSWRLCKFFLRIISRCQPCHRKSVAFPHVAGNPGSLPCDPKQLERWMCTFSHALFITWWKQSAAAGCWHSFQAASHAKQLWQLGVLIQKCWCLGGLTSNGAVTPLCRDSSSVHTLTIALGWCQLAQRCLCLPTCCVQCSVPFVLSAHQFLEDSHRLFMNACLKVSFV